MAKSSAARAAEAGAGMALVGEETVGSRLIGGAAELVGEILTPLAIGKMVYDTFNYLHENAGARDQAISNMHEGITNMAESMVKDKFPQFRPLNEHGKAQLEAKTKEMREATEGTMDRILKLIQGSEMPPELILKKILIISSLT